MKTFRLVSIVLAVMATFMTLNLYGETKMPPRENLALKRGEQLYAKVCKSQTTPVSFVYDGKQHRGLGGLRLTDRKVTDAASTRRTVLTFRLDEDMTITLDALHNKEYGEVEYTLWFENVGTTASRVLEKVNAIDMTFDGAAPVLRGCLGDHENQYAAYDKDLTREPVSFRSDGGRATHVVFPYFDLVHGDGGTLMALGWAGTWQADFSAKGSRTTMTAQSTNDFRSVLLPGERVRTALVVMLPYKGRNYDDATNLWREWFQAFNMPRANAQGERIEPFSTTTFASDTGLPNSDGSISERFYTWRRTLDRIIYEKVKVDFRWFDAGWYFDPNGNTVPVDWWGTVGTWELDTIKWPGNSFRESNEACHRAGMKVLTWFEPERVTNVDALVKNYGYRSEWGISNGRGVTTNNIGDPDCRKWTLHRITKMMKENEVDLFREDNNSDPGTTWPTLDAREEQQTGLPRKGITENKGIQGHYMLWDEIIDFCARNGKCTFIDNCASGGGRNDIESLRRSVPFMRSDADRTTTALRLSMSSTFNRWIPFHGSATKESAEEPGPLERGGEPIYVIRASWLPIYNLAACFTHDETLDYNRLRSTFNEWRTYSHLLTKDMYVLTPWHSKTDTNQWTVFAYNDRATDESVVLLFRQETCEQDTYTARLPYVGKGENYQITNIDTGEETIMSGKDLSQTGITVRLDKPKSSAVLHLKRVR